MASAELRAAAAGINDQQWSVVDEAVDRLQRLWQSGNRPSLCLLLPTEGESVRLRTLVELVKIDQELRWTAGERALLESYFQQWPELRQQPAIAVELLEAECRTRADFRALPTARELEDRFPELPVDLRDGLLRGAAAFASATTADGERPSTPRNVLRIRCPHCCHPADLPHDAPLTDLACGACGSRFSLVDHSQEPRGGPPVLTMGRFDLMERLGVGGFGTVWKARDNELDRTVAIKIPRHNELTRAEQEKFFREARAAAQLRHPGIVSVHEVGRDGQRIYIVSDFVEGVTLADWLASRQCTGRELAELCAQIAEALHHAHEHGVVHRDLKPANIMIDEVGRPHLVDFGLARRDAGELTMTLDGQVLGTPAYMSPEQARGEAHVADRRSDVYALGVILFQALTGRLPFAGSPQAMLQQIVFDEPPHPRSIVPGIPKDLATITLKCLEKERTRRYETADHLAADLRRFLQGLAIHATPTSPWRRAAMLIRRRPTAIALGVLLPCTIVFAVAALRRPAVTPTPLVESFEGPWEGRWNAIDLNEQNFVSDPDGSNNKALLLEGASNWAASVTRAAQLSDNFVIEARIWNGDEERSEGWGRGSVGVRDGTTFFTFFSDGTFRSTDSRVLARYETKRWYHVRMHYQRTGETATETFWLDGKPVGKATFPCQWIAEEGTASRLDLCAGCTVYFDDVAITLIPP